MTTDVLLLLATTLLTGCLVPTPSTTPPPPTADTATAGPTGDTGTLTGDACPVGVEVVPVRLCVETTAASPGTTSTYGQPEVASGTGEVTEVGGALAPVPGSVRFASFDACGADHTQQVRLLDGAGETWTIGWGIDGALDDGSADGILVGETLDFIASFQWQSYSSARAVLLADTVGPRFLYETGASYSGLYVLSDAQRGGVTVDVDHTDPCISPDPVWGDFEHYLVTFDGPDGPVALRSGQQATIAVPGRDLDFTLAGSYWSLDCTDGCGATLWTAWETP